MVAHQPADAQLGDGGGGGTLFVNAATVPRWRIAASGGGRERAFTMIELARDVRAATPLENHAAEHADGAGSAWIAERVDLVWVLPSGEVREREQLWPAL